MIDVELGKVVCVRVEEEEREKSSSGTVMRIEVRCGTHVCSGQKTHGCWDGDWDWDFGVWRG